MRTTRLRRPLRAVHQQRIRIYRIPNVRDDRETPLCWPGQRGIGCDLGQTGRGNMFRNGTGQEFADLPVVGQIRHPIRRAQESCSRAEVDRDDRDGRLNQHLR